LPSERETSNQVNVEKPSIAFISHGTYPCPQLPQYNFNEFSIVEFILVEKKRVYARLGVSCPRYRSLGPETVKPGKFQNTLTDDN